MRFCSLSAITVTPSATLRPPILFLSICYMIVIAFAVKIGLEAIARVSEVLMVLAILIAAVAFFSVLTDFHPRRLPAPMFKNGIIKPAVSGLMDGLLPFAEVFLALNIMPNLNDKTKDRISPLTLLCLSREELCIIFTDKEYFSVLGVDTVTARNCLSLLKRFSG